MKIFLKISVILTIIAGSLSAVCKSETNRKVQNIETFARLYGYVRWFHPSDETQEIDWDKFAVLGVQKVENIQSTKELRDTLYQLFSPIVQGLQIYEISKPENFNSNILLSPDANAKAVAWQHHGVLLQNDRSNIYRSVRANKNDIDKKNESTVVFKNTNPSSVNGKKIKFSGYFKSNKNGAKLFIQHITPMSNDNKQEVHIESQDWKKYEISLSIPNETYYYITYGFKVDGDVEVWADDFELLVKNGEKWEPVDTVNMGFERGKISDYGKPVDDWDVITTLHTFKVSDEDSHSGKYCLKVNYTGKIFERIPQFGELIREPIGNSLTCVVPLTLITNNTATYPKTEASSLVRLKSEISNINFGSEFNPQVNLASVAITWNVLQHFFPYFDVIDTDWNKVLGETLKSTLENKRKKDFFVTLSRMIAQIDDGHGIVSGEQMYHLPIRTEFIENKIVITASNNTELKRGDIIKKIDGKPVMDTLDAIEKLISGSPQLKRHRALNILGSKLDSGEIHLVIERDGEEQNRTISNSYNGKSVFFNLIDERQYLSKTIVEIEPGIYYINMANSTENDFDQKINVLADAKAVIYDQRGGSRLSFFHVIPYLIEEPALSAWWNIPQTEMGIIDHYNLATTVGESTAGCNGNVNYINLPCGYIVMWTGMRVLKHNGSQLYLEGFPPDYPVNKTIQAIKEGRDEYLEKALEIARNR